MAAFTASTTELVQTLPTNNSRLLVGYDEALVRPPSRLASPSSSCCGASVACIIHHSSSKQHVPCRSKLDTLPVEIVDRILFHLIHPRCRLPGLTETQSGHDFTEKQKRGVKDQEDLTQPADTHRWAADIFSLHLIPHPFHALSLTSRRCHELVEGYCAHLVRQCNGTMFNLPFIHLDKYGSNCVYPDLSNIVYRRLWLQHAPRKCVHCSVVLDCYPFSRVKRLVTDCADCFYRQAMVGVLSYDLQRKHELRTSVDSRRSREAIPPFAYSHIGLSSHSRQSKLTMGPAR